MSLAWGKPVRIGEVEIVPVEKVSVREVQHNDMWWASANKEPYAVLVRDAAGTRGYDLEGNEVSPQSLTEQIDGPQPPTDA